MMKISYSLGSAVLTNDDLAVCDPSRALDSKKLYSKTGIRTRRVCMDNEYALDLACRAARKLFSEHAVKATDIGYLIYCTQSPDYIIPNNSSLLHRRLGLPVSTATVDINQGCTGFIYGLSLAKGILASSQASSVLVVTADTYSRYLQQSDISTRSIFGDGAAATLLTNEDAGKIGAFAFGTDGAGAYNLCAQHSGLRKQPTDDPDSEIALYNDGNLYMNGPEIMTFILDRLPGNIKETLQANSLTMDDIDHFVFHQANAFILEHIRKKLGIESSRFHVFLEDMGNTVSSSIAIVLHEKMAAGIIRHGQRVLLSGFGVGYSWASVVIKM